MAGANLIPLLALGIPGSLSAAILIGAFLVHGVDSGPSRFAVHLPFMPHPAIVPVR